MKAYILTTAITLSVLACIWTDKDLMNKLLKVGMTGMAIWGFVVYLT